MKCFLLFLNLAFFISKVASLGITLQSETLVGSSTPVAWKREDSDPSSVIFDLRFVQGDADVGLALANIEMDEEDDGGDVWVSFPSRGDYVLKAVTGSPLNTLIGTSNGVSALDGIPDFAPTTAQAPLPAPTGTASSTPPTSSATSASSQPTTSSTGSPVNTIKSNPNLPAIAGGVIGALLILGLLAFLFVWLGRRRRAFKQRISFHKDMMVQRRQSRMMASLPSLPSQTQLSVPTLPTTPHPDIEQGLPSASAIPRPLGSGHIVPSPKGPRPSTRPSTIKRTQHTVITSRPPPSPVAPRTRRQKQIAERITMLRGQMTEMQQRPDSAHILEEMQREMVWLRDNEQGPWAMGLTDVLPPGHSRYMTP
jgi:hypothetical protein